MSRCSICDWTPSGPQSDYFLGSVTKGLKRKLVLDESSGAPICTACATIISIDLTRNTKAK